MSRDPLASLSGVEVPFYRLNAFWLPPNSDVSVLYLRRTSRRHPYFTCLPSSPPSRLHSRISVSHRHFLSSYTDTTIEILPLSHSHPPRPSGGAKRRGWIRRGVSPRGGRGDEILMGFCGVNNFDKNPPAATDAAEKRWLAGCFSIGARRENCCVWPQKRGEWVRFSDRSQHIKINFFFSP